MPETKEISSPEQAEVERWEKETLAPALQKTPESKPRFESVYLEEVNRLYTPADLTETDVPRYNPVSVSGYHIREAGATAIQELAFTLRDGIEYVDWGVKAGLDPDEFVPRMSFFFNAHNDFFEEIAKYRAARRIWAREMRDRFGSSNERT